MSGSASGRGGLPTMDHAGRRARLRALLDGLGCDLLLVTAPQDVRYLTGFHGSNGSLLIGADADADLLVTDARYRERIDDLDVAVELERRATGVIADRGVVRVGLDAEHVTLATADRLATACPDAILVRTTGAVAGLRRHKDEAELARLRRACRITAGVLGDLLADPPAVGTSERDLARDVDERLLAGGADGVAFPTIVAAGRNGASPHHEPGETRLAAGDLVTIDCGAEVDGYRADMTRTIAVGTAADVPVRLAEVHAVVAAANAAGRAAAQPGVPVADVDRAARAVIAEAGLADAFVHPTGHGIGLDVHEAPLVTDPSTASLEVGTTFTVEPGIYLPGVGGVRIEDSLVVHEDAVEVLTDLERGFAPA